MLKAQSPLSGSQIQRPKSGRKPLQPKNSPATLIFTPEKVKPTKQNGAEWIQISLFDDESNKENIPVPIHYPLQATPANTPDPVKIEHFDLSLAEELSAIREKKERLKKDKEKTEEMLEERMSFLDLQMQELRNKGEAQKVLEIEVDRLYRLNQLKLSCMSISPIKSLREKKMGKGKILGMRINCRDEVKEEEASESGIQKQIQRDENGSHQAIQ